MFHDFSYKNLGFQCEHRIFSAGLDKSMTAYNFSIIDPDGTSNFYQDFGR